MIEGEGVLPVRLSLSLHFVLELLERYLWRQLRPVLLE